jgi:glutamine---fructose-6-phosphate transaminase (isomerizing)
MCGILGYIGTRNTLEILLDWSRWLEYRGYDSAELAIQTPSGTEMPRSARHIDRLVAAHSLSSTAVE